MMNFNLTKKIITCLNPCSREELIELIECIKTASSRHGLIESIQKLIDERDTFPIDLALSSSSKGKNVGQSKAIENHAEIKDALFRVLSDKSIFRTNGEVTRTLEREFEIHLPQENLARESRQRIIDKAWKALAELKSSTLKTKVTKFFAKFGPSEDDYYQKLFKLLSRRE